MNQFHTRRPIAFVAPDGWVIPNPTFKGNTPKFITGRYLYTQAELDAAIAEQERLTNERRNLVDNYIGEDAQRYEVLEGLSAEDVIGEAIIETQTVPSFVANPKRKRKTVARVPGSGIPAVANLPDTLHVPPQNMNLSEEEREALVGIDAGNAVAAMFGTTEE